tara:strand:+ start:1011 stop:1190 length:180 start_codon:yes stop_codon:yes gene_type:complete
MLGDILASLFRPAEINAMLAMKYGGHFDGVKAYKGIRFDALLSRNQKGQYILLVFLYPS